MKDIVDALAKARTILAELFEDEDEFLPSAIGDRLLEVDQLIYDAAFVAEEMLK